MNNETEELEISVECSMGDNAPEYQVRLAVGVQSFTICQPRETMAEAAWLADQLRKALDRASAATQAVPAGMALVPDWKGYALLGTGRYCLENSAAPPDPELGAELIIRPATDKDTAGGRQLYEERDTDGGPIQPEVMAVRIGFLSASALDALEAQLRHLRAENFPESVAAPLPPVALPALTDDTVTVDRGALTMALNVLRRAGKGEVADALAASAAPAPEQMQPNAQDKGHSALTSSEAPCGDEAVERDAARYRFVRELLGPGQQTRQWFHFVGLAAAAPDTAEGFDAAIDETMRAALSAVPPTVKEPK